MIYRCEQVCTLPAIKGYDCIRRAYSPDGISPTIPTAGGGNHVPKVVVRR